VLLLKGLIQSPVCMQLSLACWHIIGHRLPFAPSGHPLTHFCRAPLQLPVNGVAGCCAKAMPAVNTNTDAKPMQSRIFSPSPVVQKATENSDPQVAAATPADRSTRV
jgi:hypothetical protein